MPENQQPPQIEGETQRYTPPEKWKKCALKNKCILTFEFLYRRNFYRKLPKKIRSQRKKIRSQR